MRQFIERWRGEVFIKENIFFSNMWVGYGAGLIVEPIGGEPVDGNILRGVLVSLS